MGLKKLFEELEWIREQEPTVTDGMKEIELETFPNVKEEL